MGPAPPQAKRELLEKLLEDGMVMVTLDARRPGVDAPSRFADDASLRLNLSYRFGLPLEINDWGVRATLTFGGMPHKCKLPWSSIYAMVSHVSAEQYVFPEDVPDELVEQALAGEAPDEATPLEAAKPPPRGRARFAVVETARDEGEPEPEPPAPAPAPAGRGHLRRIK